MWIGGTGDDTYELYNFDRQVVESDVDGCHEFRSYVCSSTLWNNVENLQLVDPVSNTNGTGNALDNVITGNAGNNWLSGLDGSDTLIGRSEERRVGEECGYDVLTSGDGN